MSFVAEILKLAHLTSYEIGKTLGCSDRYVRRVLKAHELNHPVGPPRGERNPAWKGGRMIDSDGYVLLRSHPRRISEHRMLMERELGRPLTSLEVVDHVDGLTLHNVPSNLRLFGTNGEHLSATITGTDRNWSTSGKRNIGRRTDLGISIVSVDIYRLRKARGDVRLHAILRAALELGKEHPCLLGTSHWLTQRGIDPSSCRSLKRGWDELMRRYDEDLRR